MSPTGAIASDNASPETTNSAVSSPSTYFPTSLESEVSANSVLPSSSSLSSSSSASAAATEGTESSPGPDLIRLFGINNTPTVDHVADSEYIG